MVIHNTRHNPSCSALCFRCLLKTSNHSGVEAYIIQNIKNQIDLSLKVRRLSEAKQVHSGFCMFVAGIWC